MTFPRRVSALTCLFLSAAAFPACAIDASEAPGEETEVTEDELASMKYYDCRNNRDDGFMERLELGLGASKIQVTDISQDPVRPDTGKLDTSYRPTSATYQGSARFVGFRKLGDDLNVNADFILSKELKAKASAAKLWLRTTSGEGGGTDAFWCKAKPKRLTVNTSQMGRFACSLTPGLDIPGGPPPGSTGLYDLFLYQHSADNSKITFTYLDHFGVRATPRKESISSADAFHRTTKKLTGTWGKNKLDVTYRGGITYEGTFKYEDGQSTKVRCNDLSMLDVPR